jgi:hypothetical protein
MPGKTAAVSNSWGRASKLSARTFAFTGTVNFSLAPSVSVGQAAAGSVTFESTTPNLSSVSWHGKYQGGAITSVTVSVPSPRARACWAPPP